MATLGKSVPRKLVYRRPRFRVNLPVVLHDSSGAMIRGNCVEMSVEGAGLRLGQAPQMSEPSHIEIAFGERIVRLGVRLVYRRDGNLFGVRFLPTCLDEKEQIAQIVGFIQHQG